MKDHVGTSLRSLFEELGETKQLELLTRKKLHKRRRRKRAGHSTALS